jgi:eukaryotic-like serine/threonine-protein kinase
MEKKYMKQRLSAGIAALLTTIACLIVGSSVFALFGTVLRPNIFHQQATVVTSHFLTAQAQGTVQATTQALASATATQNLYFQTVSNQPVYSDPLNEQNNSNWNVAVSQTSGCAFIQNAFHIFETTRNFYRFCLAPIGTLTDFAFQVQMTLIKGYLGGIVFGVNGNGTTAANSDYFGIDLTGAYSFFNINNGQFHALSHSLLQGNDTNPNSVNLLTVIVLHGISYLYENKQYVDSFSNTSYTTSGLVGLFVADSFEPVEAAFNNVQIWKL